MFANTSVREGLANSAAMEQLRGDDASPDGARRAPDEPDAAPAAASGDADVLLYRLFVFVCVRS